MIIRLKRALGAGGACWALAAAMSGAGLARAAAEPIFFTRFAAAADPRAVVDETPFAHHGFATGSVVLAGAEGDRRAVFDGSDGSRLVLPASARLFPKDEFTVSLWFCASNLPAAREGRKNTGTEYSLFNRGWDWRLHFRSNGQPEAAAGSLHLFFYSTKEQAYSQASAGVPLEPGRWHHAAFALSRSAGRCTLFVNGSRVTSFALLPLADAAGTPITLGSDPGNYFVFNGQLADVKLYDRAMGEADLAAAEQTFLRRRIGDLAAQTPASGVRDLARAVLSNETVSAKDYGRLQQEAARAEEDRKLEACGGANEHLVSYVVRPFSHNPIVPDTILPASAAGTELQVFAAPGEFEPASFVVRPRRTLPAFRPEAGALTNEAGRVLPASAADIRIVKVWYECVGRFQTEDQLTYRKGIGAARRLVPEILIRDDSLIRVDTRQQEQYLRLSYTWGWGPGKKYVWISEVDDSRMFRYPIPADQYPVLDSPNLLPFPIPADQNQQFWLTVRPPTNAAPGLYRGPVILRSGTQEVGRLSLAVRVLPFRLPAPKTHYDLDRDFTSSIYYWTVPAAEGPGSISSLGRNKQQYLAELKNLREHNVDNPYQLAFAAYHKAKPELTAAERDHAKAILEWRREAGMATRPVYMGPGSNLGLVDGDRAAFKATPELLAQLKALVVKNLDLVEEAYGHRDVYFYAVDEAEGDLIERQKPLWEAIREAGGKVIVSGQHKAVPAVAGPLDTLICAWKPLPESAAAMHEAGGRIWMYAYPQGGTVNPMPYRVNFGFLLYKANYDGACTYAWYTSSADPWNDFDNGHEPDLGFVYPTADGVVDAIAWEAYREAIDDIRYATAFRQRLEAVRARGTAEQKAAAETAAGWFEALEPGRPGFDPDEARARLVSWMLNIGEVP